MANIATSCTSSAKLCQQVRRELRPPAFHSGRCGKLAFSYPHRGGAPCASGSCFRSPPIDGAAGAAMEVAIFEKDTERPEDLGLSIAESWWATPRAYCSRTVNRMVI